ncbi:hypothetical protein Tco_1037551 [Tanacetum coccineum]
MLTGVSKSERSKDGLEHAKKQRHSYFAGRGRSMDLLILKGRYFSWGTRRAQPTFLLTMTGKCPQSKQKCARLGPVPVLVHDGAYSVHNTLTVTANRVIDMKDPVATTTSLETPSVMEKSPLDFSSEDPPPMITNKGETEAVVSHEVLSADNIATTKVIQEVNLEKELATMSLTITKASKERSSAEVHGLRNQTKNLETLLEAEVDMKKAIEAKNVELAKELESLHAKVSDLQLNNNQLSQQVSTLQAQVTGEERINDF